MATITVKNGITSVILRVRIPDKTSVFGEGKTGLAYTSAGLIVAMMADNEAAATSYSQAGSTIEDVTTLGTFAAPTATKCRLKEVDATNFPGLYELQIANARWAVSGARYVDISLPPVAGLGTGPVWVRVQLTATESVGGVDVTAINGSAAAAAQLARSAASIVNGAAATGTLTTTQVTTDLTETNADQYRGRVVIFTSGLLINQTADVIAYTPTGGKLTLSELTDAPSNGDTFVIV